MLSYFIPRAYGIGMVRNKMTDELRSCLERGWIEEGWQVGGIVGRRISYECGMSMRAKPCSRYRFIWFHINVLLLGMMGWRQGVERSKGAVRRMADPDRQLNLDDSQTHSLTVNGNCVVCNWPLLLNIRLMMNVPTYVEASRLILLRRS